MSAPFVADIEDLTRVWKKDKMKNLPSILSPFRNKFYTFNNTVVGILA